MVDAVVAGDLDRAVGGAVVDHEPLDHVEALDGPRKVAQRDGERLLLVQAGDLNDQLHRMSWSHCGVNWARHYRARPGECRGRPCSRLATPPRGKRHRRTLRARAPGLRPARPRAAGRHRRPVGAGGAVRLAVVGFFTWVTYPNYDSYYALLWGDELLHGHLPSFEAYRAPTEHPLAVAFGAALSVLGQGRRPGDGADHAVRVRGAGGRHVQAGAHGVHPVRGRDRRVPRADALRLPVARGARLPRHPVHGRDRVGGRAGGRAAAPRHAGVPAAGGGGPAAPRGVDPVRRLLPVDELAARTGTTASATRR